MNFLSANTTNHRRLIMLIAAEVLGVFMSVVVYRTAPLTYREFVFPPVAGLVIFEILFRFRQGLRPLTLPIYILIMLLVSEVLYGILYGMMYGNLWTPLDLQYLFGSFPYNLYSLIDTSIVTGFAYYLIKHYRQDSWLLPSMAPATAISNEPIEMDQPVTDLASFMGRYRQQIQGFVGWFIIATLLVPWSFGLITTPVTIICLIVFGFSKTRKGIAGGILVAVALNFFIALARGLQLNAWCFMPFYYNSF